MPKKSPKKTNGVEESVVAAVSATQSSATQKTDSPVPEKTVPAIAQQDRTAEIKAPELRKTGKPEIVKSESRSNLVPISLENEIRKLAYLFSERRGFEPGHEAEDWLNAEREVLDRYHQHQQTA
jgi:hypothetical protein